MKIRHYPYTLELTNTFTIAHSSRKTTPAVMLEIEHNGLIGYGEASLPPYLGETIESVQSFLSIIDSENFDDLFLTEDILYYIDSLSSGDTAAKAAFDIALHDLVGKAIGFPIYRLWGLNPANIPCTSYTIGIDTTENIQEKVRKSAKFKFLKVKLGTTQDRDIVTAIREISDQPIRVDANGGWHVRDSALKMIEWLAEQKVELIEQPMPKTALDDTFWLKERSPLPLIADESVQRLKDIPSIAGAFDGINIKLMKCTGMREAYKMILLAKSLGLKIMIGCMTETSCAISAAAQLSPLADWVDLDGALLIRNDLFRGAILQEGKIVPSSAPGIGISKADYKCSVCESGI